MMSLLIILTHLYNTLQKNIDSQSTNAFRDNSKNKRTVIGRSSPDVLPMGGRLKKPSIDVGNVVKDLNTCMKEIDILFF